MQTGSTLLIDLSDGIAATHLDTLARYIGILQQLQRMLICTGLPEATLADTASFVVGLQQEHGFVTPLEDVIQTLVGRHILLQYQIRQSHVAKIAA